MRKKDGPRESGRRGEAASEKGMRRRQRVSHWLEGPQSTKSFAKKTGVPSRNKRGKGRTVRKPLKKRRGRPGYYIGKKGVDKRTWNKS